MECVWMRREVVRLGTDGSQPLELHESSVRALPRSRGCLGSYEDFARVATDNGAKVAGVEVYELPEGHALLFECAREALLRCHGSASQREIHAVLACAHDDLHKIWHESARCLCALRIPWRRALWCCLDCGAGGGYGEDQTCVEFVAFGVRNSCGGYVSDVVNLAAPIGYSRSSFERRWLE